MSERLTVAHNRLLRELIASGWGWILPQMQRVELHSGEAVYNSESPEAFVFFPETAIISLVVEMECGRTLESSNIGCEGFLGPPIYSSNKQNLAKAVCLLPGSAWRATASDFLKCFRKHQQFSETVFKFVRQHFELIAHSSACSRIHSASQRCALWLLFLNDRNRRNSFPITQEYIAELLGVRRSAINPILKAFQNKQLIKHLRGRISITDRAGLEELACPCYRTIVTYLAGNESYIEASDKSIHLLSSEQSKLPEPSLDQPFDVLSCPSSLAREKILFSLATIQRSRERIRKSNLKIHEFRRRSR